MRFIPALAIILFWGCNSSKQTMQNNETLLTSNTWILKTIYQANDSIPVSKPIAFIHFDPEKNSAGGKGGCNSYGAQFKLSQNNISFSNSFSTKMFCQEYQHIEDRYFEALAKVNRYIISENGLVFYEGNLPLLAYTKK